MKGQPDGEGTRQGQVDRIARDQAQRMAGPFRAAVPRIDRAGAHRRPAAALQAPQVSIAQPE